MTSKVYKNKLLVKKITISAACLALAFVLPFLTGAIPEIGGALCPMHLPAFLAGALLGPILGGALSFIFPILRSLMLGSPTLFPRAISMAFELFAYAAVFGLFIKLLPKRGYMLYPSLVIAMLIGRLVGGAFKAILYAFGLSGGFGFGIFFTSYFAETLPGIILQLIVIPPVLIALSRAGLFEFKEKENIR